MAEHKNGAAGKGGKKISKMEAVRRALDKLGHGAMPSEMRQYIKSKFGIEMTTGHISNYKGTILQKEGAATDKPASTAPKARPHSPAPAGGSVLLEDVLTVRALLDRVGAKSLRVLIDGLAKKAGRA